MTKKEKEDKGRNMLLQTNKPHTAQVRLHEINPSNEMKDEIIDACNRRLSYKK